MRDEIPYMLGVIGTGFLVNYTLRALPFLIFAGRDRALPKWVERLGNVISPVIIACLIVYAYSGSQWTTPWPYLAGVVTVLLQIWKRNPLVSIVAGTLVYMLLVNCCGCTTTRTVEFDAVNPAFRLTTRGVLLGDEYVTAREVVDFLEDSDVPHSRVIHIRLDPEVRDLRTARLLMAYLAKSGYTRPVLVTERSSESYAKPSTKKTFPDGKLIRRADP